MKNKKTTNRIWSLAGIAVSFGLGFLSFKIDSVILGSLIRFVSFFLAVNCGIKLGRTFNND